jgi:hypothetical protein
MGKLKKEVASVDMVSSPYVSQTDSLSVLFRSDYGIRVYEMQPKLTV